MTESDRRHLKATINRILDDSARALVPRSAICARGASIDVETVEQLREWEREGYLRIVGDLKGGDDEIVLEMLRYFDRKSPIPGFLNWE
jgi:IS5 family transposase